MSGEDRAFVAILYDAAAIREFGEKPGRGANAYAVFCHDVEIRGRLDLNGGDSRTGKGSSLEDLILAASPEDARYRL